MSTVKFNRWLNSDGTNRETVYQVIQSVKTDTWSAGGSDIWYDTGFSASITPKFNTSRIFINFTGMAASSYWELQGKFMRSINGGSYTDIGTGNRAQQTNVKNQCGFNFSRYGNDYKTFWYPVTYKFIDIPQTTSSITYKLYMNPYSSNTVYLNRTFTDNDSADYWGCPISTITLMEIGQ